MEDAMKKMRARAATFRFPASLRMALAVSFVGLMSSTAMAWESVPNQKAPELPTAGLVAQTHQGLDRVYVRPGVDLAAYEKFVLTSVTVAVERRRSDDLLLSSYDAKHAVDYMKAQMASVFGPTLASQADPRALSIEVIFTDYAPNRSFQAEKARGGLVDEVVAVGGAAIQIVARDGRSGETILAIADDDRGLPLPDNINRFSLHGDANQFTRRWVKQLREIVSGNAKMTRVAASR
jgi:Protein of unknown function (DUF3313)